jgi:predicted TIM-barrel fold metal-dependent hydrolase
MIVDSHVHLGGPDRGDGATLSAERLINTMDNAGVERAVVFPFNVVDPGKSFSGANDFIAEAVTKHPGRLIGFARLDPNRGDRALKELERALTELGLKGVKLHPKGQNFRPTNKYVSKIVERAADHRVPVVFDNGKAVFDNHAIGVLAQEIPDASIILAHMRGEGFIEIPKQCSNVFLGAVKTKVERVEEALTLLSPEKIIAGSDTPYADMAYEIKSKFEGLNLGYEDLKKIQGDNLLRLVKD